MTGASVSAGRYTNEARARVHLARAAAILLLASGVPARAQSGGHAGNPGVVESVDDSAGRPWAEDIPLSTREKAYRLFLAGNELMKEALFAKGGENYTAALALWDHPAFHYNLGVAQMNLDQIIEAYWSFERALRHGARPIGQDKHELARHYLKVLGNQLAEVELICDEPGAAVALDGKPLFVAPGRRRVIVRPGGHRVEATKADRVSDTRQLVLDPGDEKRVTLTLRIPEYLATVRRWPQWISWAVVGAGAAVVAGGGYLDLRSSAAFDEYDSQIDTRCTPLDGCGKETVSYLQGQLDRARTRQWLARGFYLTGGLTVATGSALLYLNRERIVRRPGQVESPAVSFTPVLAPHTAGVSVRMRF